MHCGNILIVQEVLQCIVGIYLLYRKYCIALWEYTYCTESIALWEYTLIQEVYSQTLTNKSWHKKNYLKSCVDIFVFHSSNVFVQYSKGSFPEEFGAPLVSCPLFYLEL